jgi:hypothetical protein
MRIALASLPLMFCLSACSLPAYNQTEEALAVDQADSLDVNSFHKDREDSEKRSILDVFSSKKPTALDSTEINTDATAFIVKQPYTLSNSTQTRYSAFSAIDALHQQMAKHCPKGWIKDGEWVTAIESDYLLHYQFRCIK